MIPERFLLLTSDILTLDLNAERNISSFRVGDIFCNTPELFLLLSNNVVAASYDVVISAPKNVLGLLVPTDAYPYALTSQSLNISEWGCPSGVS